MYYICAESREGVRFTGTEVTDGSELICGCSEPNPDPLQEQQVLRITKPSLHRSSWSSLRVGIMPRAAGTFKFDGRDL